jgi:hypothetical protein
MFVQGLGHASNYHPKKNVSSNTALENIKSKPQQKCDVLQDSVTDRDLLVQQIREKVKKGFYNSDAVAEDLSHGFAKVFDESI